MQSEAGEGPPGASGVGGEAVLQLVLGPGWSLEAEAVGQAVRGRQGGWAWPGDKATVHS